MSPYANITVWGMILYPIIGVLFVQYYENNLRRGDPLYHLFSRHLAELTLWQIFTMKLWGAAIFVGWPILGPLIYYNRRKHQSS